MSQPEISLVIFDMDGVLYSFDSEARFQAFSKLSGKPVENLRTEIWHGPFEREAERGAPGRGDDYLSGLSSLLGASVTRQTWIEIRKTAMTPNYAVLSIAASLAGDTDIAMLSNNAILLKETLQLLAPEAHAIFGDRAHVSAEFSARKPEIEVFRRVCEKYRGQPKNTLFIDDNPDFIAGAVSAGLQTHLYETDAGLRQCLRQFGLL